MKKYLLCLFLTCFGLAAAERPGIILRDHGAGMFSACNAVLSLLDNYTQGNFSYAKVDFGTTGLYYSPAHGPNWWEYYFEPIELGKRVSKPLVVKNGEQGIKSWTIESSQSRFFVNRLIQTFIKIRPEILQEIDEFCSLHFSGRSVIGLHYRGTDKIGEAPRVPYSIVAMRLSEVVDTYEGQDYVIFVATDEQGLLDFVKNRFPGKICCLEDASRSTDGKPLHFNDDLDPYLSGKHALMDCILLSRTDLLMRTSSNLSRASTFFNPELRVIELSRRYGK